METLVTGKLLLEAHGKGHKNSLGSSSSSTFPPPLRRMVPERWQFEGSKIGGSRGRSGEVRRGW